MRGLPVLPLPSQFDGAKGRAGSVCVLGGHVRPADAGFSMETRFNGLSDHEHEGH